MTNEIIGGVDGSGVSYNEKYSQELANIKKFDMYAKKNRDQLGMLERTRMFIKFDSFLIFILLLTLLLLPVYNFFIRN